jgi:hypothetical protein
MRAGCFVFLSALLAAAGAGPARAADALKPPAVDLGDLCDVHGPGFRSIGGTDICVEIGGSVSAETGFVAGDDGFGGNRDRLDTNRWSSQVEGRAKLETRMETDIGTIRTVIELEGVEMNER